MRSGAFGVGSDSNTLHRSVRRAAPARVVAAAVAARARNVLAAARRAGRAGALRCGGARRRRRCGHPTGAIAAGCRADLVVLDTDDPALAAQPVRTVLDAAVFGPCRAPVRDVMVGGRWVVRDGHHPHEDAVLGALSQDAGGAAGDERATTSDVRPADHRRASRDDGAARRRMARFATARVGIVGETIAWVGRRARPAARRVGASIAPRARRVGDARA